MLADGPGVKVEVEVDVDRRSDQRRASDSEVRG